MKKRARMYISYDDFQKIDVVVTLSLFILLCVIGIPLAAFNIWRYFTMPVI